MLRLGQILLVVFVIITWIPISFESFTSTPKGIEYAECQQAHEFNWKYSGSETLDVIKWFIIYKDKPDQRIAEYTHADGFKVILNAEYPPAKESRIEYIPGTGSAALLLLNLSVKDQAEIRADVDFKNIAANINHKTKIVVIVSPVATAEPLPVKSPATKGDAHAKFQCTFKSNPKPDIKWFKNDQLLGTISNKQQIATAPLAIDETGCEFVKTESSLVIVNIELEDAANITCSTSIPTDVEITASQTTYFEVQYAPGTESVAEIFFSKEHISGDQQTTLTCKVLSIPPALFEIYLGTDLVTKGHGDDTGRFDYVIGPARFHHEGNYTCVYSNKLGEGSIYAFLNVTIAPQFWGERNPSLFEVFFGAPLEIPCRVFGDPLETTDIEWKKVSGIQSSYLQVSKADHVNSTITYLTNTLKINKVTVTENGEYKCTSKNFLGEVSETIAISVYFAPQLKSSNVSDLVLALSSWYTFSMSVDAYPLPNVTWYVRAEPLPPQYITTTVTDINGFKKVTTKVTFNATMDFFGKLECVIDNGVEPNITETGFLKFPYKPDVLLTTNRTLIQVDGMSAISTFVQEGILLNCTVRGFPLPRVDWYRDDMIVSVKATYEDAVISEVHGYMVFTQLRLTATVEENHVVYTCKSSTDAGIIEQKYKIYVLHGDMTKPLGDSTCFEFSTQAFLDWRYAYTQPVNSIKWSRLGVDGSENALIGKLSNRGETLSLSFVGATKYDNNNLTLSGLYVNNVTIDDESWYSVLLDFHNSPRIIIAQAYLCVSVNPMDTAITPPEDVIINEHDATELTCQTTGKPPPEIFWRANDEQLETNNEYEIRESFVSYTANLTTRESLLRVKRATVEMNTQYTCLAVGMFNNETAVKNLTVHYPPKDTNLTALENPVAVGRLIHLTCATNANPTPLNYLFYRDNKLIKNLTQNSLKLENVEAKDEGLYTCVPSNIMGEESNSSLFVFVNVAPVLMHGDSPVNVNSSNRAVLSCTYYGDPPLTIEWSKPTGTQQWKTTMELLHRNASFDIKRTNGTIESALIQDSGVYNCKATNSFFSESHNITLLVRSDVAITASDLSFVEDNGELDKIASRHCTFLAAPKVHTVEWYLNGVKLLANISKEIIEEGFHYNKVKSTLLFPKLALDDAGTLKCRAENDLSVVERETMFYVHFLVETTLSSLEVTIDEGEDATFVCSTEGQPKPNIVWRLNEKTTLDDNNKIKITEEVTKKNYSSLVKSTIAITNALRSDYKGVYTCMTINVVDTKYTDALLNLQYAPDSALPRDVYVEGNGTMMLNCSVDANPRPTYNWSVGGIPHTNTTETFVVEDFNFSDEGNYTCTATNKFGSSGIILFRVAVQVPPNNINASCTASDPEYGDRKVTCMCQAEAVPPPTYTWFRKGDMHGKVLAKTPVFEIDVAYTGSDMFTCHVTNPYGTISSDEPAIGQIEESEPYSFILYVLIPLLVVLIFILAWLLCRRHSKTKEEDVLVPVNRNMTLPGGAPYTNNGYDRKEFESIEVNLMFDNEISELQNVDVIRDDDGMLSDATDDVVSNADLDVNNVYEELPADACSGGTS